MRFVLLVVIRILSAVDFCYRRLIAFLFSNAYLYERRGSCKQCGQCCKEILIYMEPKFLRKRILRNFAIWWNKYFNKMRLIGCFIEDGYMVYACTLQLPNGKCGNYYWRPFFCREYPRAFKYFEIPTTLPRCGYKFLQKNRK